MATSLMNNAQLNNASLFMYPNNGSLGGYHMSSDDLPEGY